MTRRRKAPRSANPSAAATWEVLTWNDLDDWAGARTVSRGRSYQRQGRVKQLCLSEAGVLLAWVAGGERYATRVELDATKRRRAARLKSKCSCPVRFDCKHAVAIVVEYLKAIEEGIDVPAAAGAEPRWAVIEAREFDFPEDDEGDDWFGDDRGDEDAAQDVEGPGRPAQRLRSPPRLKGGRSISDADIRAHLDSKSREELVGLVMQISDRDPDVRRALADECALAGGKSGRLLRAALLEMRSLTAEHAWWDSWKGEGTIPDYSGLEKRLKTLLDHGHADGLVELGEELVRRGVEQVGHSHDDGETACQIGDCLRVVKEALLRSNRSDEDKIIYAIDVLLEDDYGVCDDFASVLDRRWKKATWSTVADRLSQRLDSRPKASKEGPDWLRDHARERLSGYLLDAFDHAARSDEATQLCVSEARDSGSYPRAVRRLLETKDLDRAGELAEEGIREVPPLYAGIISDLQDLLCEIATKNGDWTLSAAVAGDRFFNAPSVAGYRELVGAAKRAGCEREVQDWARHFLETGWPPYKAGKTRSKRGPASPWPLPEPPRPKQEVTRGTIPRRRAGPHFDVLIDLAIDETRPDDVLKWFDKRKAANESASCRFRARTSHGDTRIAEAVESSHPDRAIAIYQQLADSIASETNTKTYPEVGGYLRRIKRMLKRADRSSEWPAIVGEFRSNHGRKPRLMRVIDGIEGRPIVKGSRK